MCNIIKILPFKVKLFFIRVKTAIHILAKPKEHWFIICVTEDQLIKSLNGEESDLDGSFQRLTAYNVRQIIHDAANGIDFADLTLEKTSFQIEADEWLKNNKQ